MSSTKMTRISRGTEKAYFLTQFMVSAKSREIPRTPANEKTAEIGISAKPRETPRTDFWLFGATLKFMMATFTNHISSVRAVGDVWQNASILRRCCEKTRFWTERDCICKKSRKSAHRMLFSVHFASASHFLQLPVCICINLIGVEKTGKKMRNARIS